MQIQIDVGMLILLNDCTPKTPTKSLKKKLNGKWKMILRAILNKSWKQHPIKKELYDHLSIISQPI